MAPAAVAVVAMVASAAVAAYSSYESGRQQQKAAEFNAGMAEYNAKIARDAAKAKEEMYSREAARKMGTMRQQLAMAGVEPTAGTPLTVLMEASSEVAKDKLRIAAGGEAQAWGFLSEAELSRSQGQSAMMQGTIGAGASLLGGAARVGAFYSMPKGTTA